MIFENKILFKTQVLYMQNDCFHGGSILWGGGGTTNTKLCTTDICIS